MASRNQDGIATPMALTMVAVVAMITTALQRRAVDLDRSGDLEGSRLPCVHAADGAEAWARAQWRGQRHSDAAAEPPPELEFELGDWRAQVRAVPRATAGTWDLVIVVAGQDRRERFVRPW